MEIQKENTLARVNFTGGNIGVLERSQFAGLEKVISAKNRKVWDLADGVSESRNLVVGMFQILLILSFGLWTLATGHILVFERQVVRRDGEVKANSPRKEPTPGPRRLTT